MIRTRIVLLLGVLLVAGGCAGREFTRPQPGTLVLGQTTYQGISRQFGDPYRKNAVFKEGHTTDFDESKVALIKKRETARTDVERLMGPASGLYVFPLIKNPGERALVYLYTQCARRPSL